MNQNVPTTCMIRVQLGIRSQLSRPSQALAKYINRAHGKKREKGAFDPNTRAVGGKGLEPDRGSVKQCQAPACGGGVSSTFGLGVCFRGCQLLHWVDTPSTYVDLALLESSSFKGDKGEFQMPLQFALPGWEKGGNPGTTLPAQS